MTQKEINFEEKLINEILNEFNFERCHKVMKHLGWVWISSNQTPSVEKLKETAEELLRHSIESSKKNKTNDYYSVSTGGLKATAYRNKSYKIIHLKLEFIIAGWETDGDE